MVLVLLSSSLRERGESQSFRFFAFLTVFIRVGCDKNDELHSHCIDSLLGIRIRARIDDIWGLFAHLYTPEFRYIRVFVRIDNY